MNHPSNTNYSELNHRVMLLEVHNARADEQRKQLGEGLERVEGRLDKIDGNVSWLVKLVASSLIVAIVGFLLSGALVKVSPSLAKPPPELSRQR